MKKASITLDGAGMRFVGRVGSGHAFVLDDNAGDTGMRPSELVPAALAGCTAMDVISILRKKHQVVTSYEVTAAGEQAEDHPHEFRRIDVVHIVEGNVDVEALRRAIELSATRYCSVGGTLSSGVTEIHHVYRLRTVGGEELSGDVVATGPHREPRAEAASPA